MHIGGVPRAVQSLEIRGSKPAWDAGWSTKDELQDFVINSVGDCQW